jgi:hypothetical protein
MYSGISPCFVPNVPVIPFGRSSQDTIASGERNRAAIVGFG